METSTSIAARTNVQLVQDAYNNFSQGNIQGIIDFCAEDVIWSTYKVPEVPFSGTLYGKEGVLEFFTGLSENVQTTRFEPKEFFSQGDDVFVLGSEEGYVKQTGSAFTNDWCMHFHLKDGKLKRFFAYDDSYAIAKAFRQVS